MPAALSISLAVALAADAGTRVAFFASFAAVTMGLVSLPIVVLYVLYSREEHAQDVQRYRRAGRRIRREILVSSARCSLNRARQRREMRHLEAGRRKVEERIRVLEEASAERIERLQELTERMRAPFQGLLVDSIQSRADCEAAALQLLQREQIRQSLRSTRIWSSEIPRVTVKIKVYLWFCGIRSAEAIRSEKATRLDRFDGAVSASLLRWRRQVQSQASRSCLTTLPPQVLLEIAAPFSSYQDRIEQTIRFVDTRGQRLARAEVERVERTQSELRSRLSQAESQRRPRIERLNLRVSAAEERTSRLCREMDACDAALSARAHYSFQAYLRSRLTRRPFN